jgi:hypothetical protein
MAGMNLSPRISLVAGGAIAPNARVKWSGTKVVVAGDEACIGVAMNRAYADGDEVVIIDQRAPGTRTGIAVGAIAVGAAVTSAANGQVASGTAGVQDYGKALTAATGAGEYIEYTLF